jgi:hypothetical protein
MPLVQNPIDDKRPAVGKPAWWHEKAFAYGHGTNAISIAVLSSGDFSGNGVIRLPQNEAFCGVAVQQSTPDDIGVLLGVPPQNPP